MNKYISVSCAAVMIAFGAHAQSEDVVGMVGGQEWHGRSVYVDSAKVSGWNVRVLEKGVKDKYAALALRHLIIRVPVKTGVYDTQQAGITFFTPPGDNLIPTKAKLEVTVGATNVIVYVTAVFDPKNSVSGRFEFAK